MNKYLTVAALFLAVAMLDGIYARREEAIAQEATMRVVTDKAALLAARLTHCLNGGSLEVSGDFIDCKRRK